MYSLMSPESGRVLVDGSDVATDPVAARRALGVLPDARWVYKRLTARENIPYFGELHGLPRAIVDARIGPLHSVLQLEELLDRQPKRSSHGHTHKTTPSGATVKPHRHNTPHRTTPRPSNLNTPH